MEQLKRFGNIPVDYSTIASSLSGIKSPKDKISKMVKAGNLIRLRKGLFIVSTEITDSIVSKELIANHLRGPSYVSMESALSYYHVIPERVYHTYSATIKRKRKYSIVFGNFNYITVPEEYYSIGLRQENNKKGFCFLIASPEKALCDLIITRSGIRFQSKKAVSNYLIEDLRIDLDLVRNWDLSIIEKCVQHGYKRRELQLIFKFIENECSI